jgi:hypothetical protein
MTQMKFRCCVCVCLNVCLSLSMCVGALSHTHVNVCNKCWISMTYVHTQTHTHSLSLTHSVSHTHAYLYNQIPDPLI